MVDANAQIGVGVIESLTKGLYDGNLNFLREYVQNGIDAGAETIHINYEDSTFIIRDTGSGMDRSELEKALCFGISDKINQDEKIGWRGIGIWSGIPISKELIILTKKKGGEKLSVTIKSEQLSGLFNNSISLVDAVNQCKSEIAIVQLNDGEENEHFTEIRLAQVIEGANNFIYDEENVRHYLSRTLPVSFDSEKFKYANEINEWLKSAKVVLPTTRVYYNNIEIHRPPTRDDVFSDYVGKYFLTNRSGEVIAAFWFLVSADNKQPESANNKFVYNNGIYYKKSGFTIGDQSLITDLITKTYHKWQYGEIHIISPKIIENTARNNFENNGDDTRDLFEKTKLCLENFQKINHTLSKNMPSTNLKRLRKLIEAGEDPEDYINDLRERVDSTNISDAGLMSDVAHSIIDTRKKEYLEKINHITTTTPVKKSKTDFNDSPESENQTPLKNKDIIKLLLKDSSPEFKTRMKELERGSYTGLESAFTDVLIDKLRKKTGSTAPNFGDITKDAFGWNNIQAKNNGKSEIPPKLILDQTHLTDFMSAGNMVKQKNMRLGVFLYTIHDLFVNATKHKRDDESYAWIDQMLKDNPQKMEIWMISLIQFSEALLDKTVELK